MASADSLHEQLASLHSIAVEITGLHALSDIHERALDYCLELTQSEFAFTGLLRETDVGIVASGEIKESDMVMDVAAIKGFDPSPQFYELFHRMALRSSVVGVAVRENRSYISNDVPDDPHSVGQPDGHPPIRKFLGVPLRLRDSVIGMIGVANKRDGYGSDDERLLATFAGPVAVAVDNARLYEGQRLMIRELRELRERLTEAEQAQLLRTERERIAGALHDRIEQDIFTIGVRLNMLLEHDSVDDRVAEQLRELRRISIRASDGLHGAIFSLAGAELAGTVTDRVKSLLRTLERSSELHAHLSVSGHPTLAAEAVQDVVHLVVNEALTNVRRHAHARMVLVSLRYELDRVDVVIQDDGVGAPDALLNTFHESYLHFGLRHIRQVVLDRGGSLEVANGDEAGLVVRLSIPISEPAP